MDAQTKVDATINIALYTNGCLGAVCSHCMRPEVLRGLRLRRRHCRSNRCIFPRAHCSYEPRLRLVIRVAAVFIQGTFMVIVNVIYEFLCHLMGGHVRYPHTDLVGSHLNYRHFHLHLGVELPCAPSQCKLTIDCGHLQC